MTGPEHFREAERLLGKCHHDPRSTVFITPPAEVIAVAQVHAILSLAAATALATEGGDGRLPSKDRAAWFNVAAESRKAAMA